MVETWALREDPPSRYEISAQLLRHGNLVARSWRLHSRRCRRFRLRSLHCVKDADDAERRAVEDADGAEDRV